ncbi:hypothetical protein AWC38_SpisGene5144 [Stylophora pistillata]|uniref:DNA-directed DNA polymerase n=1 Tax=Stylophora pistillata TaxID=50429 RepID=A0A2B4SLR3_STYPI|nr:hypothetical protein AWC38_SpisGene5144 [Stylophora pistillata]
MKRKSDALSDDDDTGDDSLIDFVSDVDDDGANLREIREPSSSDDVGKEISEALTRSIRNTLRSENVQNHHMMHFNLQSDAFPHAFQSITLPVEEVMTGTDRFDSYMVALANKLNSGEAFNSSSSFNADLTIIQSPQRGGKFKFDLGKIPMVDVLKKKKSVIMITNTDELCCGRAIVMARARTQKGQSVDKRCRYDVIRCNDSVQKHLAEELHEKAGVPFGPCGIEALRKFQSILSDEFQRNHKNESYDGQIPDESFYDPDGMSSKTKEEFLEWHRAQVETNGRFFLKEELITYCQSDVKLLKEGCMKFVNEFRSIAGFDPFEKCITIASACNRYWRKCHSPSRCVAVEPINGWEGGKVNHSKASHEWLHWCEYQLKSPTPRILHVRNGGEQSIIANPFSYHVDGLDSTTNTVYEFHGCLYHGCRTCFPDRMQFSFANPDRTMDALFSCTMRKTQDLRTKGYHVVEMWECEWKRLVSESEEIRSFLSGIEIISPLVARGAFFGGLTGAASLYCKADEKLGEDTRYVDVTSEDPWVNKYGTYPVGHPIIYFKPKEQDISAYFGIACVDVLPPLSLFNPVLPYRHNNQRVTGLFSSYVNTWLKIKQESGGWPSWAHDSNEKKEAYLKGYNEQEGIALDSSKIEKNQGRKTTAKLMLNSFWGKFGERMNKYKVEQITEPHQLFDLITNPLLEISSIRVLSSEVLEVTHRRIGEDVDTGSKPNIFIAIFTTCQARLKLYESLSILNERVLYYDTDSCIYTWKPTDPLKKTIRTEKKTKRYGLVFDKRIFDSHTFKSFPYGYLKYDLNDFDENLIFTLLL